MAASMLAQRAVAASMRRLAMTNTSRLGNGFRFAAPSAIAMGQVRRAATASSSSAQITAVSADEAREILAAQRRNRPSSPHLSIYQPQITWYLSIMTRITGCVLSGGFYIFGFGYLVAPYVGLHWESASVAASFAALPIIAKLLIKAPLAACFSFHGFNGIRHLVWDTGSTLTNKQVIVTGWLVLGLTAVSSLGLIFY